MDSAIVVAIIGAVATVIAATIGIFSRKKAPEPAGPIVEGSSPEDPDPQIEAPRLGAIHVTLTTEAEEDCRALGIAPNDIVYFILDEAEGHSALFRAQFSSLPLLFRNHTILISWDDPEVCIERVLRRDKAYPLNDAWASCLSLYRRATVLRYRTDPGELHIITEAQRSINTYRRLAKETKDFLRELAAVEGKYYHEHEIDSLLSEADFTIFGDVPTAIARMEALLSTVHKLLLQHAPQGTSEHELEKGETPQLDLPPMNKLSALVVDNERKFLELMKPILEAGEFEAFATTNPGEAMEALVQHDFDLVIADLLLPSISGNEILLASKKSNVKAKTVLVTGYPNMASLSHLECDLFMDKPNIEYLAGTLNGSRDLVKKIRGLID